MTEHKLIFVGPVGSGKTTAISTLSDIETLSTDAPASDITGLRKPTTTVAFDYGHMQLSQAHKVKLYGTPGQMRFSFMWDMMINDLAADSDSVILLLDNTRSQPQRDLKFYSQEFSRLIDTSKLIIGVTRSDLREEPNEAHYREWIDELGLTAELFFIDARRRESLIPMLQQALPETIPTSLWEALLSSAQEAADYVDLNDNPEYEAITSDRDITPFQGDHLVMKQSIVDDILHIKGVEGAILADSMGDIINSSMDNPEIEEYIGFMAGMVPSLQNAASIDDARSILVKSPSGNSITIFIEQAQILGVVSAPRTSIRTLKQQVEDILQWD